MKKTLGIAMVLMVAFSVTMIGLAADQTVTVNIPAYSNLTLSTPAVTITFPTIDTWTSDTYTQNSDEFDVITRHNGSTDPDITVSSSALANSNGTTLDLSKFVVYLTPQGQNIKNGALNSTVTFENVGKGRKVAKAYYGLTIDAEQESGQYTGTVTYTLVNQ
jgi:hypothetical protein